VLGAPYMPSADVGRKLLPSYSRLCSDISGW
jgi:hypothetical protein